MKKCKQILLAILMLTFITACDEDDSDSVVTLEKATISAKWNVDNSSEYESFEFNESGLYFITKNVTTTTARTTESTDDESQSVFYGTYEIIDDETVVLSNFGTLTVLEISKENISFSGLFNSDEEITINASKQEEISNTAKTELLCKTWKIVEIDGVAVNAAWDDITLTFTEAGTTALIYLDEDTIWYGEGNGDILGQWNWQDTAETYLQISHADEPDWDETSSTEIIELTSNTLHMGNDILVPVVFNE